MSADKDKLTRKDVPVDAVNPSHYRSHPSGVEALTVLQHHTHCVGSAMKYLWRCGLKDGADPLTDLRKAKRYIEQEIDRVSVRPD